MKCGEILVGRLFSGRLEIYKGMGVKYTTCYDHEAPRLPSQHSPFDDADCFMQSGV